MLKLYDMNTKEGRDAVAKYEQERDEKIVEGQQLYAKIKRSSKYYGQTNPGELFPVYVVAGAGDYHVQGGPGSQYRLKDVNLYVVDTDGVEVRIS